MINPAWKRAGFIVRNHRTEESMNQDLRLYIVSHKDGSQKFFESNTLAQKDFKNENAIRLVSLNHKWTLLRILDCFDQKTSATILGKVIEAKDSSIVWKKEK